MALALLVLVVISATTGILLGWKKNIGALQPPTRESAATDLAEWRALDELSAIASRALAAKLGPDATDRLVPESLDVRPSKGIVKVVFPGTWEVQVEGGTGVVRSVARRHSDWIESIHDGSIISDGVKLVSMNLLGFGLLVLSASGFWMWYGAGRLRRLRLAEQRKARKAA